VLAALAAPEVVHQLELPHHLQSPWGVATVTFHLTAPVVASRA